MNMQSIRGIVKQRDISPCKLGQSGLVRTLQREEGDFDCFAKAYAGYWISPAVYGGKTGFHCRSDTVKTAERRGGPL